MKSIQNQNLLLIALMGFAFLTFNGCEGKWKQTSKITLAYQSQLTIESNTGFTIEGGELKLDEIHFEGKRQQSSDVEFEEQFSSLMILDLATDMGSFPVHYDIPQGTYSPIDLNLRFDHGEDDYGNDPEETSMLFRGTFTESSSEQYPVLIYIEDRVELELELEDQDGLNEIILIADASRIITLQLNVGDWFNSISKSQWDDADTEEINGEDVIIISSDQNSDIYDEIIDRIGVIDKIVID